MSKKDEAGTESNEKGREKWKYHINSLFSLLGYIVGLGNIWRFPWLCMKHGGGAFLIPYTLFLLLCGMPTFFIELAMGQFTSLSPIHIWKSVPLLAGIGWSYWIISFIFGSYLNIFLAWILYYIFKSFAKEVPWATCGNWWNTEFCSIQKADNSTDLTVLHNMTTPATGYDVVTSNLTFSNLTKPQSPSEEFFTHEVLRITDGIHDMGGMRWEILGCAAFSWLLIFLSIMKGTKSLSNALYVTVTLPYVCLVILLVRGLTLPGSWDGVLIYLRPEWSKLLNFEVWGDACMQIFYTLGPGWGGIILMASFNQFSNNCQRDAMLLSISCCVTSFFAGFVVFSILGFMANDMGVSVLEVARGGPGLVFIVYPEAITRLPLSPLWAIIFFVMLLTVGIDALYAGTENAARSIIDAFPNTWISRHSTIFTGIVCLLFFLSGTPFLFQGGMYLVQVVDWFVGVFSIWLIVILETLGWGYIYGVRRLYSDIEMMLGRQPFFFWKICWCFITPFLLISVLFWSMFKMTPPTYGDYVYPGWVNIMGWMIAIAPSVPIVVIAIFKLITTNGTFMQRLRFLLKPSVDWGPATAGDREGTRYELVSTNMPMENDIKLNGNELNDNLPYNHDYIKA